MGHPIHPRLSSTRKGPMRHKLLSRDTKRCRLPGNTKSQSHRPIHGQDPIWYMGGPPRAREHTKSTSSRQKLLEWCTAIVHELAKYGANIRPSGETDPINSMDINRHRNLLMVYHKTVDTDLIPFIWDSTSAVFALCIILPHRPTSDTTIRNLESVAAVIELEDAEESVLAHQRSQSNMMKTQLIDGDRTCIMRGRSTQGHPTLLAAQSHCRCLARPCRGNHDGRLQDRTKINYQQRKSQWACQHRICRRTQ